VVKLVHYFMCSVVGLFELYEEGEMKCDVRQQAGK
jgi:hypothetical protein